MIRVIVVDDHPLVRHGVEVLLERMDDIQIVGQARDGAVFFCACQSRVVFQKRLKPQEAIIPPGGEFFDELVKFA